jgi:putative transposase
MARTKRKVSPPDTIWEIPDNLWPILANLLSRHYPPARTGRPRVDFRPIINGIIYRLRSGVQWNQLPPQFGSDSTVHRWFQRFNTDGIFEELWAILVEGCDDLDGVSWEWQAADTVLNKARFGGTSSAKTPQTEPKTARNAASSSTKPAARSGPSSHRRTLTTAR